MDTKTPTNAPPLRVALPKGRIFVGVESALAEAGITVTTGVRALRPTLSFPSSDAKLLKPRAVVEMLHSGRRDVGFAGADWVEELDADVIELLDLRRVFLRQRIRWPNGWPITVYERSSDNPIREQFTRIVLGMEPGGLRKYWLTLRQTRAMNAPKLAGSTNLLKRHLERVKGGIGYMYLEEVDNTVKVIRLLEIRD